MDKVHGDRLSEPPSLHYLTRDSKSLPPVQWSKLTSSFLTEGANDPSGFSKVSFYKAPRSYTS